MIVTNACRKGHEYTPENTRLTGGVRQCRECDKNRAQARRDVNRGDRPKFKKKHLADKCFRGHDLAGDNLYFYETKNGTQRRCRACQVVRDQEHVARGVTVQPTKTHCVNGHPMEGENLSFRPNGHALCRACALAGVHRSKNANYDKVMDDKYRNRRRQKAEVADAAASRIISIYAETLDDDTLIARLREALPPAER